MQTMQHFTESYQKDLQVTGLQSPLLFDMR